jgi:uncharacterized protein involved in outer membrane biogenesis
MSPRALRWAAGALALLLLLLAALPLSVLALIDRQQLRTPLLHFLEARLGRELQIDGPIETHLLSFRPRLSARGVTIGSPPWSAHGPVATVGTLTLELQGWPIFGRELEIHRLVLEDAALHLVRDAEGAANWQASPPHTPGGRGGPPLIHSLSVLRAQLELDDQRRHLQFEGTVSAHDEPAARPAALWHLEGAGRLNGQPVSIALNGDALAGAGHTRPYRFAFDERSASGSRLDGRGELPQPFDLRLLEVAVEASGADLKDLFYLVGVSLPDTGHYQASVRIERQRSLFRYSALSLRAGGSDLQGTFWVETRAGRPHSEGALRSDLLRTADIGAAAAGRGPKAGADRGLLLSDKQLALSGMRAADAQIDYQARELQLAHLPLHRVVAHIGLAGGTLSIAPLSATLYDGTLSGQARLDASREPARTQLSLRLANLRPSAIERASSAPPPFEGRIDARIELSGQGRSLHQWAATASGTVTAIAPGGALRAAFADLIGADFVQGLGLLLAKDDKETAVRCGVASFDALQGDLRVHTLLLDTEPVLIRGEGDIRLDDETLALTLSGQPKARHLLRLRQPLLVGGTFAHPTIGLRGGSGPAQTTRALALGVARAPLEVLGFVDADLAANSDCAALLRDAQQQGVSVTPPAAASPR